MTVFLCTNRKTKMATLDEAHFIPLPSQTNIYGLARITDDTESTKVLVGSLNGKVTCVEYINKWDNPLARELSFTYIPSGEAEIVSIDGFMRPSLNGCNGIVVGISFVLCSKNSPDRQKQFLNIYSSVEEGKENNLDSIAEGCQHVELDFVPFQLCHAQIKQKEKAENVFLLSGSDQEIHMYLEVMNDGHLTFEKQNIEEYFPELQNLPSNVLWMDLKQTDDKRFTAIGCQDGHVQLSIVDTLDETNVKEKWSVQHDGPITSVKLFTTSNDKEIMSKDYHLLVCCALEPCTLYLNATSHGFDKPLILPDSDLFDCVLCTCIADVDWDGDNELLLGTFGQELLVYKISYEGSIDIKMSWKRSFTSPLFAIDYLDMTRDGLCEVVVACLSGIHVLQHQLDDTAKVYTSYTSRARSNALLEEDIDSVS